MVKVYFQDAKNSNLVAIFENEELYLLCLPHLELSASMQNMIVVESIEEKNINELE